MATRVYATKIQMKFRIQQPLEDLGVTGIGEVPRTIEHLRGIVDAQLEKGEVRLANVFETIF